MKRRLRWLEGFGGSVEYAAQDVEKERDWLREEIRILSDRNLREQQKKRDERDLAKRDFCGHSTDEKITMHPRMMYAHLFGLEKSGAMWRRFRFICSIPPSPEYIALDQTKESDWLAAEIESAKEQILVRASVVGIVVVLLAMSYGVGS